MGCCPYGEVTNFPLLSEEAKIPYLRQRLKIYRRSAARKGRGFRRRPYLLVSKKHHAFRVVIQFVLDAGKSRNMLCFRTTIAYPLGFYRTFDNGGANSIVIN